MADSPEQMAFSFFQEVEEVKKDQPVADRDFETEDEALDALLAARTPEGDEPPFDVMECCESNITPSGIPGERFSVSEPEANTLTDEDEEREIDAALERIFGGTESFPPANIESEMQEAITQVIAETAAEEKKEAENETEKVILLPEKRNPFPPLTEQTIRRAALGFLAEMKPDGAGMKFPSGVPRIRIDAGAFFLNAGKRNVEVAKTVLVMTCMDRDKCWIDASYKADLLKLLGEAKAEKAELEEMLKIKEPDLKDDSLFPESQNWDFSKAKSRKYHACLRKIEKIEYSIYHGSKFERLMFEQCADEYYLAVPAGLIAAEELPEEWGLVYIAENYEAAVIRPATPCRTTPEKRAAFALRAAAAGAEDLLFANGISLAKNSGKANYHLLPKRRKIYS